MKQEDFDQVKKLLGENGFDITMFSPHDTVFQISKKDPWEGVEFAEYFHFPMKGLTHFKIEKSDEQYLYMTDGSELFKDNCKPSTEQAYVEQLKAKFKELFGVINHLDQFEIDNCSPTSANSSNLAWQYFKEVDILQHYGATVYQQGKWAKRVKERVRVDYLNHTYIWNERLSFDFKPKNIKMKLGLGNDIGQFLASKLEEYLNSEK